MYRIKIEKMLSEKTWTGTGGEIREQIWSELYSQTVEEINISKVIAVTNNHPFVLTPEDVERIAKKKLEIERR